MGHLHGPGDHDHGSGANKKALAVVLAFTFTYMVVEVISGLLTGSLALLADAAHMLSDNVALGLALFAVLGLVVNLSHLCLTVSAYTRPQGQLPIG